MNKHNDLYTLEFDNLNKNCPLSEYPFPQFKRDSYVCLNGIWKHKITKNINDLSNINEDILVPFPIESNASGVQKRLQKGEYIIYKKEFTLDSNFIKDYTFLHFLGVDQQYYIILNDQKYDWITPLNLPTKIDVSNNIKENNILYVIVKDDLDFRFPLGKQSNKPKGIFYTPFSGIYFPVFIESVNEGYIENIEYTTTMEAVSLNITSTSNEFNISIYDNGELILNEVVGYNNPTFKIPNPKCWHPNHPHLYDIKISTHTDEITSYFGLREIKMKDGLIYLNNEKIFLNGVLDQGYYPEGIITPITYDSLAFDVLTMKELGFNTLRKHIKVELPYFYYLCDKNGMLIFQDFVNNGKYNFLIDTALPTIGLQKKNDKIIHTNKDERYNFVTAGESLIEYLNNHPSIIAYTIFNEGWGQFDSNNVYHHFKIKYPNILFDSTSGWYRVADTDMDSYHWYFKNLNKLQNVDHPIFLSEFGALCYKVKDHAYGKDEVFGYTYFPTIADTEKAFIDLYEQKIIPYKDKLIGTIYTQLSDVEEEDNGLLTYDRKVLKFNKEIIKNILKRLNN